MGSGWRMSYVDILRSLTHSDRYYPGATPDLRARLTNSAMPRCGWRRADLTPDCNEQVDTHASVGRIGPQ